MPVILATEKITQTTWTFFQSLANDDVKVNKTQEISAKIDRFGNWAYCLNFEEIKFIKWKFRISCETKLKNKSMENIFSVVRKIWKAFTISNVILACNISKFLVLCTLILLLHINIVFNFRHFLFEWYRDHDSREKQSSVAFPKILCKM